jgi:hypothetical protein
MICKVIYRCLELDQLTSASTGTVIVAPFCSLALDATPGAVGINV